jgi:hypothetical protein
MKGLSVGPSSSQVDRRLEAHRAASAARKSGGRGGGQEALAQRLEQLQQRHRERQQGSVRAALERQKLLRASVGRSFSAAVPGWHTHLARSWQLPS